MVSRRLIGEAAMSDAERKQRRRDKAKALRDAAPPPDVQAKGSAPETIVAPPAEKPGSGWRSPCARAAVKVEGPRVFEPWPNAPVMPPSLGLVRAVDFPTSS
jgi:hypothetical protein